jgi:3-hydroxybutyryl-CoA dehydrogenase
MSEAPQPQPEFVSYTIEAGAVGGASHAVGGAVADALAARLRAAGIAVAHRKTPEARGHAAGADEAPAFHCNGAAVYLTDGRSATQRAQDNHHPDTGAVRPRPGFCHRQAHRTIAFGPVLAGGVPVGSRPVPGGRFHRHALDDVPGMAVMRTVAMLANEAADAVNQGVCSASGVDTAMQKGVNYPRGPLAWADAVGVAQIVAVLGNLAASYGEDRYRVSPLLRRKLANGGSFHA